MSRRRENSNDDISPSKRQRTEEQSPTQEETTADTQQITGGTSTETTTHEDWLQNLVRSAFAETSTRIAQEKQTDIHATLATHCATQETFRQKITEQQDQSTALQNQLLTGTSEENEKTQKAITEIEVQVKQDIAQYDTLSRQIMLLLLDMGKACKQERDKRHELNETETSLMWTREDYFSLSSPTGRNRFFGPSSRLSTRFTHPQDGASLPIDNTDRGQIKFLSSLEQRLHTQEDSCYETIKSLCTRQDNLNQRIKNGESTSTISNELLLVNEQIKLSLFKLGLTHENILRTRDNRAATQQSNTVCRLLNDTNYCPWDQLDSVGASHTTTTTTTTTSQPSL